MESSKKVDDSTTKPSCDSCLHQAPDGLNEVKPLCWDCTSFKTLVYWEPMVTPKESLKTLITRRINMTKPNVEPPTPELSREDYAKLHEATEEYALDTQVGGSHYKSLKIQPMEYSMANNLDACQHTIIKYVTRYEAKGGKEDLLKARHAIDLLIGFKYVNS